MNVIFICTANVCRSPLAEGYLKFLLKQKGTEGVNVSSAGIVALSGAPAFECAIEVARQFQFDITAHRAQQLTAIMAEQADRILCMEPWQASAVLELTPKTMEKVSLLGSFHPKRMVLLPIPDPKEFNAQETLPVFELIRFSVDGFLESLAPKPVA
jgi:protein-tyrosine-phosphatase